MLHNKDIHNIEELQSLFRFKEKTVEILVDYISFFDFRSVTSGFDNIKKKGYSFTNLLSVLVVLPFLHMASLYALMVSGLSHLSDAEKDAYYRLKNNPELDWRGILYAFANRYRMTVRKKGGDDFSGPRCLVLDDSVLGKTGKKIERIGMLWDHVFQRYVLGFKLLCLGYWDGKSFVPLDFSLHREKGSNQKRPYGLTKKQLKAQYSKDRCHKTPSAKRITEMGSSKIENGIKMVKRAIKKGIKADYLLMDSWFTCEKMLKEVLAIKKCKLNVLAMMKMGKAKYVFNGTEKTAKQLVALHEKKIKRCRKLNAHYIPVMVDYKGVPLLLFFSRYGRRGKWHLTASTNLSLSFIKAMEIYQLRWAIEVFFKESKQHLGLGKCQSNDLDAHFASITISMVQYIMLILKKRFEDYESNGALFRESQEQLLGFTLMQRLWGLFIEIVTKLAEVFSLEMDLFMEQLFENGEINFLILKLLREIPDKPSSIAA